MFLKFDQTVAEDSSCFSSLSSASQDCDPSVFLTSSVRSKKNTGGLRPAVHLGPGSLFPGWQVFMHCSSEARQVSPATGLALSSHPPKKKQSHLSRVLLQQYLRQQGRTIRLNGRRLINVPRLKSTQRVNALKFH